MIVIVVFHHGSHRTLVTLQKVKFTTPFWQQNSSKQFHLSWRTYVSFNSMINTSTRTSQDFLRVLRGYSLSLLHPVLRARFSPATCFFFSLPAQLSKLDLYVKIQFTTLIFTGTSLRKKYNTKELQNSNSKHGNFNL